MAPTDDTPADLATKLVDDRDIRFRRAMFTAVVIAITLLLCVHREGRAAEPDGVEQSVRAVLDQQVSDWNAGNLDGFMTGYWKD